MNTDESPSKRFNPAKGCFVLVLVIIVFVTVFNWVRTIKIDSPQKPPAETVQRPTTTKDGSPIPQIVFNGVYRVSNRLLDGFMTVENEKAPFNLADRWEFSWTGEFGTLKNADTGVEMVIREKDMYQSPPLLSLKRIGSNSEKFPEWQANYIIDADGFSLRMSVIFLTPRGIDSPGTYGTISFKKAK